MISPCVKNHPEEKLAVPFRAKGTTHTTTQSSQNPQESSIKLKYHLPNQHPSLLCKFPLSNSVQANSGESCRLVLQHLIPIKRIFRICDASVHRVANSLITGSSSILFFPSPPPCYRGGILVTILLSFPPFLTFPGSNRSLHTYTASKAMPSNSTNTQQPMHLLHRPYFPHALLLHFDQSSEKAVAPCATFLHQEERARMISQLKPWLQALAYGFLQALGHLWKATRLTRWLTVLNNALKGKSSPRSSRFIQSPVPFTATWQDSVPNSWVLGT